METYYLCRVPWSGNVVLYTEPDYKFQRHHESQLRKQVDKYNVELLAHGSFIQMHRFKKLMQEET